MGPIFEKSLKNFSDCYNRIPHSIFGTATQLSDFFIAEIVQSMKQKPLPLLLGAEGQYRHDLVQGFPLADYIFWGGTVGQASLGSNYVLVTFPAISIPLLFPVKFPTAALVLFPKLPHLGRDFNGHHMPINFDGNFHLAFSFRSVFSMAERKGRGATPGPVASCSENVKIRMAQDHTDR